VPTLLATFPHPDDESLAAGGLLAHASDRGFDVRVLCLSPGEGGRPRASRDSTTSLGDLRCTELEAACAILGAQPPRCLDWADGGFAARSVEASVAELQRELKGAAPEVVVTYGPDGGYGHADHVYASGWIGEAFSLFAAGCKGPAPRLLHAAFAPGIFAPVHKRLSAFLGDDTLVVPEAELGTPADAIDLSLPLTEGLADRKRRALSAHASQLPKQGLDGFLAPGLVPALCAQEDYRCAQGPAIVGGAGALFP
jgi:N-acetyl-1-D-myo-inositol-2-amino-2-deoxy-alpha-D-glucopyranoside deacetylase